jgi:hypothetical protein
MRELSLVLVLAEDERHRMLIRRFLIDSGCRRHAIRIILSPSGQGSAEKWVRSRFPVEVAVYRSRQAQTGLIVVIDADILSVAARLAQLEQALTEAGMPAVSEGERIARVIPKRNIETWILHLTGTATDEETDYKRTRDDWNALVPVAAESLCRLAKAGPLPPDQIPSLQAGVTELRRLN